MIASSSHQAWLFYSPLAHQVALLKDDLLDPVDQRLEDPDLVDLVRQCLAKRSPRSTRTGRSGIAPDRLLRCCVMKHLKGWSFRDLERELRSNLVYRRFTHFDADTTPDFTVFSRSFALLSPAVTAEIHQRVLSLACEQGAAQGRRLRTDSTVVESNVHYPTDSSLLGDGIRVLSRSLQRIAKRGYLSRALFLFRLRPSKKDGSSMSMPPSSPGMATPAMRSWDARCKRCGSGRTLAIGDSCSPG